MRTSIAILLSATVALAGLAAQAQSAETEQDAALPLEPGQATVLSVVDRWKADPLAIFVGADVDLDDFKWIARPVIVFANSENDPAFQDQMRLLLDRPDALSDRDVVLITDTDPDGRSGVRLKLRPRGFMLALIGKEGDVQLRKPLPWSVRELVRSIDKSPIRQREMNETPLGN
ncbi:DUF4174 domain-containing protein [Oceaniglobus ichthyenteri]|uniref:DUF4174 domain-containing protein n=1 Tax=Oceaniglobus ichthyenteri TaxID=2136177 RepID=UPI000D3815F1|nr:DUF4174 domain-containing protein [Oceaniglobus ichthyenteri]